MSSVDEISLEKSGGSSKSTKKLLRIADPEIPLIDSVEENNLAVVRKT